MVSKFGISGITAAAVAAMLSATSAFAFDGQTYASNGGLFEGRSVAVAPGTLEDPTQVGREYPSSTRTVVNDPTDASPGSITVDTKNRYLYLSMPGHEAMRYDVGVGRQGFAWSGQARIGRKAEWPSWTPPSEMLKRRPDLPRHMQGGIENPLGARAMYLYAGSRDTMFRIHGSNEPDTIGQAVSSGCIRMLNDDVVDLYSRVKVGTQVTVLQ